MANPVTPSNAQRRPWRRADAILLSFVVIVGLLARLPTIARQFERDPEGCGAFYGTVARNYFRYGIVRTWAVPIQNIGVTDAAPVFYPNHPPLLPLLIAGVYRLFGWNPSGGELPPEWQTRLPTTLFTLACIAAVFVMLRTRANLRAATFAALLFALAPITILFGSQPDVINPQLVFFALLTVAAYERFARGPSFKTLALLCLAFALAAATDWPAFYLCVVLGVHFVFTQPPRRWTWIAGFGVACAACFFLLYAQGVAATHDWRWMKQIFLRRAMAGESDGHQTITLGLWLRWAIGHNVIERHTVFAFAAMLLWIALSFRALRQAASTSTIWLLLCWAMLHVLVGRQGVFVHEWWWWPLTPGLAMAAGVAIDWLLSAIKRAGIGRGGAGRAAAERDGINRAGIDRAGIDSRILTALAAMIVLALGCWNVMSVRSELAHPFSIRPGSPLDYSVMEMGEAIRAAAAPNQAVMLAESDTTLGLWFYGDRPLKRNVWDPAAFEKRLGDGAADLQFELYETWTKPPVAMIVPKAYMSATLQPLLDYLIARYPMRESAKFYTFDIRSTTTTTTAPARQR